MQQNSQTHEDLVADLERKTFRYFQDRVNPENGLVADSTGANVPASIAVVGLALASYPVGVERAYISRAEAVAKTLTTLRFFSDSRQGPQPNATGYKGFYYHFLDMKTGQRDWNCELSTIDTTFLLAGALTAAAYFNRDEADERAIQTLADALYRRADWQWVQTSDGLVSHGWTPEKGFIPYRWEGYNEALLLYILGLGSPTYPLPAASYSAWASTYRWEEFFGYAYLYAGPLFLHQLSHIWIDFRGIRDAFMRQKGIDYFENSRRATYVQQAYAIRNPHGFKGYGEHFWGITASGGPGPSPSRLEGDEAQFFGYLARGVPYGPDDGTICPWAVAASLPFAPKIVLPTLKSLSERYPDARSEYGFKCSLNLSFPAPSSTHPGWITHEHFGINQGPVVLMLENFRSDLIWRLMRSNPYIANGLRRAGFTGGWLEVPMDVEGNSDSPSNYIQQGENR